jgi:hypothetical protein
MLVLVRAAKTGQLAGPDKVAEEAAGEEKGQGKGRAGL